MVWSSSPKTTKGEETPHHPGQSVTSSSEGDQEEDWLDSVCDKATLSCPVPNDLPPEAFENIPKEDVLDHVFEGIERSLSLTTAARMEKAERRKTSGGCDIETSSLCGSMTMYEEDVEAELDSIVESTTAAQQDKDALDRVFENVEKMTCGPSADLSPYVAANKKKKIEVTMHEEEYVTRADLENDGVRFRDDKSMLAPEKTIAPYARYLSKGEERPRWWIWLIAGILTLILIITGAVLLGTG